MDVERNTRILRGLNLNAVPNNLFRRNAPTRGHITTITCKELSLGVQTEKITLAEKWRCTENIKFVINYEFRRVSLYFSHLFHRYKAEFNYRDFEVTYLHPEKTRGQANLTMILNQPAQFWVDRSLIPGKSQWERVVQIPSVLPDIELCEPNPVVSRSWSPTYLPIGDWTVYRVCINLNTIPNNAHFNELLLRGKQYRLVPTGNDIPYKIFNLTILPTYDRIHNIIEDFDLFYILECYLSQKIILRESLTYEFLHLYRTFESAEQAKRALAVLLEEDETRIWNPTEALKKLMNGPYFESLRKVSKKKVNRKKNETAQIRKVFVTPTNIILELPYNEPTNRVLRHYRDHVGRFLRVQFTEEGKRRIQTSSRPYHDISPIYNRIKHALVNGIQIGSVKYEFLAYSSSQMREHGCWFFASTPDVTASNIRKWMGDFSKEKVVAKNAARMGQCFSSTHPTIVLQKEQLQSIPDIIRNNYTFSDGVGIISKSVAMMVATKMRLPTSGYPSAFQFRLGGAKGMLCVSATAQGGTLSLRPSQVKFTSNHRMLEINRVSKCSIAYLNRQVIQVMSTLGVPDSSFIDLMNDMIEEVNLMMSDATRCSRFLREYSDEGGVGYDMAQLVDAGFLDTRDPYLLNLLHVMKISKLKAIKKRAKILIPKAAHVFGVIDETNSLKKNEVFCQLPSKLQSSGSKAVLESDVVVYRSPSLHPGDVRKLKAVDCEKLRHLENVIVFSQQGERDVPSMCSGGDLDGDTFTIIWDERLFPPKIDEPMDPDKIEPVRVDQVKISNIQEFLVNYIISDNLGQIANAHMALADKYREGVRHPECMMLASLHSQAVDFPKTGVMVDQKLIPRPNSYPDFMEKHDKQSYESSNILGKLYRSIDDQEFLEYTKGLSKGPIKYDHRLQMPGMEKHIAAARLMKLKYDQDLESLLSQFGLKTEAEFMSGALIKWHKQDEFRNFFDFRRRVRQEMTRFRNEWRCSKFPSLRPQESFRQRPVTSKQVQDDMAKAAAYYYVTYHPKEKSIATTDYGEFYRKKWYLSFAWIAHDLICKVLRENQTRSPRLSNLGKPIPEHEIQKYATTTSSSSSTETSLFDDEDSYDGSDPDTNGARSEFF